MTIITLDDRRRKRNESRLLSAAKAALEVMDTMSLDDLMEGKDAPVRAELVAAIREAEDRNG